MPKRRSVLPVTACALCMGFALMGEMPSATALGSVGDSASVPTAAALHDMAVAVEGRRRGRHADLYAGVTQDGPAGKLDIYLTSLESAVELDLIANLPPAAMRFHAVTHTESELRALQQRIFADIASLEGLGVTVTQWGPQVSTNRVMVGVDQLTAATAGVINTRYGSDWVTPFDEAPSYGFASRQSDVAPWNGGDFITNGVGDCTSGPPVVSLSNNQEYLMTAGHCFEVGTVVRNYMVTRAIGSNAIMGTVTDRSFDGMGPGPYLDVEFIKTEYSGGSSNLDWGGPPFTAFHAPQVGWTSAQVGDPVCTSGAYDGELCNLRVTEVGWRGRSNEIYYNSLDRIQANDLTKAASGRGDSGAPVFMRVASGLLIEGIVHGPGGGTVPCPYNTFNGKRQCTNAAYIQDYEAVKNVHNLQLKTS
jgi:hypothetical protein